MSKLAKSLANSLNLFFTVRKGKKASKLASQLRKTRNVTQEGPLRQREMRKERARRLLK